MSRKTPDHKSSSKSSRNRNSLSPIHKAIESLESRRLLDGSGLTAQFFNTTNLTGTPVTRVDSTVNFNWTNGAPDNALNPDNYTARWSGQVQAVYSQTYTFSVNVTGGARLWVNNQQIINQWSATGTNNFTGTIALTAGQKYAITLEYAEKTGNAAISLSWSSASQANQIIPQSALYSWTDLDIGSPGSAGSSTYNSSTGALTLSGAGNYWLDSSDSGHMVYQQVTGDADISVRLTTANTSMATGLFMRNSLNANSAGGVMEYFSNSVWSVFRHADGEKVEGTPQSGITPTNIWLRLIRKGDSMAGYYSVDGISWFGLWGRNITLNSTVYIGLFASSTNSGLANATYDNIKVGNYSSDYSTSWVGNSFNGAGQWVQNDIKGIFVDPATGTVFANSPYDEGAHEAAAYQNGQNIGGFTDLHGWARSGGWGIVADADYVYLTMSQGYPGFTATGYPPSGTGWSCIRRYSRSLYTPAGWTGGGGYDSSMLIVNTNGSALTGLTIIGNNLYVSDPTTNQVKIYNKTTMTYVSAFTVARPGQMAVDGSGNLWIVSYADANNAAKILKYNSSGTKLSPEITGVVSPLGIGYNPATGQLLVTDDGPRQQILMYSNLSNSSPTLAGTLGDYGGIASGTPGQVTPTKFDNPSTVAADAAGNIYVGFNGLKGDYTNASIIGIGQVLRSFSSSQSLNWEVHGLEFVDTGALDPSTDGVDLYTKDEHFTLNYNTSGVDMGTWVGRTVEENTNPTDSRLTGDSSSVWMKVINGQKYMFATGMAGISMVIYKQVPNTELFQQCASIRENSYNGLTHSSIWRDLNNDGIQQTNESVETNLPVKEDSFGFDVDSQGNVWSAGYYSFPRKYTFTGLDANNNPMYSATVQEQTQSTIFNRKGRVAYDAATDTMYISGWTAANPYGEGDWGWSGSTIARYNNWSTNATLAWSTVMPYVPPITISNAARGISLAGNRLFVGFISTGTVRAYDTTTGALVEEMVRGPEIGGYGGWLDVAQPINAFRRSNGEYVITVEDDLLSKVSIMRAGGITPTSLSATAVSGSQINLSWSDNNNKETGFTIQRSTDGTNYSDLVTLPANMTTYSATGLTSGTTYYFRARANNTFDNSPWSTAASATTTSSSTPAAPSNLNATAASSSQINLTWTDNANNETGFSIDRATNSGFTTGLVTTTVGANVTSSNITGLSASTLYYFRVRATNGAGSSANSATASATTQAPAVPNAPSGLGATAVSSSQINLSWTDNSSNETGFSIDRATNSTFTTGLVTTTVGVGVTSSNITGLSASTLYYFRVKATGSSGDSANTSTANATTQSGSGPIAPSGLSATATSTTDIFLTWSDNSSDETGFQIDVATVSDFSTVLGTIPLGSNTNNNTVSFLTPNTTYYFRIRATGASGNSAYSNTASATTQGSGPTAPSGLGATTISSSQINLAWTDNSSNETGFSIDRATNSGFTTGLVTTTVGANVTSSNITGLTAGTTYYFRVKATGSGGDSAYTATANATTSATIPTAPSGLGATAVSSSQINLAWTDNSSNETGFSIDRATNSGFTTGLVTTTVGAGVTSSNITGLSASTTYYFRVRATGSAGNSAYTATASATTSAATPTAPSGLGATAVSSSQINLAWTDNSSNETGFSIDRATNSTFTTGLVTTTVGAGVTSSNITGLSASTTYYFRVKATGSGGDSAYTSTASAVTQPISLGIFTATSDIGSVGVAGSASYSSGTGIYSLTGSGADIWDTADAFRYIYTPLNGDGEIIAKVNSLGNSDPWAKTGVMVRESLAVGSAHAMMAITSGNGAAFQYRTSTNGTSTHVAGASVAAPYWVRMTRVGNVLTGYISSNGSSWTQVGQTTISMASSVYIGLAVTSHNNSTTTSADIQQVTLNTLPAAPSGLTATTASSSQINLAWTDNSSNETGFAIDRATNSGFTTGLVTTTVGAGVTSSNITGLSANTTYYFRVRATNSIGASSNTSTASATTQAVVPTAPSGLGATAVSSSQINLAWTDNSSNETGFSIDRATNSTFTTGLVTTSVGAGVTSSNITGLSASTTYYFRVRATGSAGNSAYTATASATTSAAIPTAPSGLGATAVSSSQINLAWTDNSSNETGFSIDRATNSTFTTGLVTTTVGSGVTSSNITGLSAGTTYYFRVKATGTGGDSAYTATANATTQSNAPAAPSGLSASTASSTQIFLTWSDNSSDETGFQIDVSTVSNFASILGTIPLGANTNNNTVAFLTPSTTYYFRIRAIGTGGNSANSNTASATTSA